MTKKETKNLTRNSNEENKEIWLEQTKKLTKKQN